MYWIDLSDYIPDLNKFLHRSNDFSVQVVNSGSTFLVANGIALVFGDIQNLLTDFETIGFTFKVCQAMVAIRIGLIALV